MSEVTVTKENFEAEVLNSDKPVLLDFWATWCGPCQMLSPIMAEIADEYDSIKVGTVNVDDQPELARQFHIMSIPTVIAFEGGKKVADMVGFRPKEDVLSLLNL